MNEASKLVLDLELTHHDVQPLSSPDAVAALFTRLGYDTSGRTKQTAANLGITAEGATRPIKNIELIASQEGGLFQVYLLELSSVNISHTRTLARAFRNRAGNYLLVLTSDYERLDFVILEKYLPPDTQEPAGIGQKQVGIRPRILTVDRLKPERVHLRVLRRFTWTESDAFAQYDKLLGAYATADWSEDHFNNRAIFSDYYLLKRLPDLSSAWKEDPKPVYLRLRTLYQGAADRFVNKSESVLRKELVVPVLDALGFKCAEGKRSGSPVSEADYRLHSPDDPKTLLAGCLVYPWARSLDGKDDRRDKETPEENPGAVVVSLLEEGESPWVIVTNGKLWRLYSQKTHSRATNYYEIDLDEVLAESGPRSGDFADSFRYFWAVFRRSAFEKQEMEREGKKVHLSLLDRLVVESEEYAKELGERLKTRVFEDVFPHLASGFIHSIREQVDPKSAFTEETLDRIFQGTLTPLYRILFLLYAEARDLLPVREVRGYFESSLTKLKKEIAESGGKIEDESAKNLGKAFRQDSYGLYDRLLRLFRVVDEGEPAMNVPMYNGGLFLTKPDKDDETPEAQSARFLNTAKVADAFLAPALDRLSRDADPKLLELVFIDYKSLGVRQLGSIYEGLLEFKLRIAGEKLAIVKEKNREFYVPFEELDANAKEKAEKQERIVRKGQSYLENNKRERKATGSYYTPDYIVKYIVEHAIGPVFKEKFEAMRPKLREAQQARQAFFKKQEALGKQGIKPEPASKADLVGQELVDELFNIKVLDPAMGSGHFLVEAVDFITDKTLDFLNAFPWNPVAAYLERMRNTIFSEMDERGISIDRGRLTDVNLLKRHVLKRCIYGVDLNPMAVELAKVSLWLDCFTLGAPLSFLDHHLRCGNSLIGVSEKDLQDVQKGQLNLLGGTQFAGVKAAAGAMIQVGALPDVTSAQTRESRKQYNLAVEYLAPFKRLFDAYASQWFGNEPVASGKGKKKVVHNRVEEFLRDRTAPEWSLKPDKAKLSPENKKLLEAALRASEEKRFFHWEIEFPEVFYGPRPGTQQTIERLEGAGFDAVVGNPPYVRQEGLGQDKPFYEVCYKDVYSGVADVYVYFYSRGLGLCRVGGRFGMITSNKYLRAGYGEALRKYLKKQSVEKIIDFRDLPLFPEATAYPLVLIAQKENPVEGHQVKTLSVETMGEAENVKETVETRGVPILIRTLRDEGWTLQRPEVLKLLEKIRAGGRPLREVIGDKFYYGIKTGYNEAFVIDGAKRQKLIAADPKSDQIIKPFLRGRDIKRWRVEWAGLYLIFTRRGIDINSYPAVKEHLLPFKKRLTPGVPGGRKPGSYKWYEIQDSIDYYAEFGRPTIRYQVIATYQQFAFTSKPFLSNDKTWIVPSGDLTLLAVLNSRVAWWFLDKVAAKLEGGAYELRSTYVGEIPIPAFPERDRERLAGLVAEVSEKKRDAKEIEREIDRTVCRLYGLTDGEIAIVEGSK
ncbi:MAG: Eco57I restriction-modification methylase domain-containing protein [Nitrospirae bacterium]|nr:Eco57I restriction-modification methylase domain-containing protein [Nitrospirota bacterium]